MFDGFAEDLVNYAVAEMARDKNGKLDPFSAAGISFGQKGKLTNSDIEKLGRTIGVKGGFDESNRNGI